MDRTQSQKGWSQRNFSFFTQANMTTQDNHHSKMIKRTQKRRKNSRSTKMSNLSSEKAQEEKIEANMKTLQELVPNSHMLDNRALLSRTISYIKALQNEVQMMQTSNPFPPFPPPNAGVSVPPFSGMNPFLPHFPQIPFAHPGMLNLDYSALCGQPVPPSMSILPPNPYFQMPFYSNNVGSRFPDMSELVREPSSSSDTGGTSEESELSDLKMGHLS